MTIISNSFSLACRLLLSKYTISTLQSIDSADNQHGYGRIWKFPQVSINKISITLLLFPICLGKSHLNPLQKYKKSVIHHSTITDFIMIYSLISRFCIPTCGLGFSINSSFFRLNQLTCETPSMRRLNFPSLSSFSEHIVLSALKYWLNSQE